VAENDRTCSTHGGEEKCIQNFGSKLEGKRPLGKIGRTWEDNIRMNLRGNRMGRYKLDASDSV
jgi:hypothetical protein